METGANKPISEPDVNRIRANLNECHELAVSIFNRATEIHQLPDDEGKSPGAVSPNGIGPEFVEFTGDIRRVLTQALKALQQFC